VALFKPIPVMAVLAAMSGAAFAQSTPEPSIPGDFQGIWGLGAEACRAADWHSVDTLIRIGPDAITYWESECRPVGAVRRLQGGRVLKLEFTCTGEGETWEIAQLWGRLAAETGDYMVTVTPDTDQVLFYRRCDASP
jgi:hypothetical protein